MNSGIDGVLRAPLTRRRFGGLIGGAGLAVAIAACAGGSPTQSAGSTPVKGGTLKVGVTGGGASETLDAGLGVSSVDFARIYQLYDPLVYFNRDGTDMEPVLAEHWEQGPDRLTWTIRLRKDVHFHNGKPLTADDVIFTMKRLTDPQYGGSGELRDNVDQASFKRIDDLTLSFATKVPNFAMMENFADYSSRIIPVGYDPQNPVGTGPFVYQSFTPGQQSMFTRNDNYFRGAPHVDQLNIVSFNEDAALSNALLSGQIDMAEQLSPTAVTQVKANPSLKVLTDLGPTTWTPFVMRTDVAPFNDPRVRMALKLMVDREQMIRQVYSGEGVIQNDHVLALPLYGDSDLQQRPYDPDQAKSLLKQAGAEGLKLELATAPIDVSAIPAAEAFAKQAQAAGVTITVAQLDSGAFYGDQFLQRPFTMDYWGQATYSQQAGSMLLPTPGEPYNETHWDDPEWRSVMQQAGSAKDRAAYNELIQRAQRIENERGGYINWAARPSQSGYSARLGGVKADAIDPFASHDFREVWISS